MKNRSCGNICKNAIGTMLLLAGAFFVCSTLVSMRAVLADPIAPVPNNQNGQATMSPRSGRASPRGVSTTKTAARPTANVTTTKRAAPSRGVATRNTGVRANVATTPAQTRGVVARSTTSAPTRATASTRGVRARATGTSKARVSLSGDAIQGLRGTKVAGSTYYTYLSNKLYTGNYSNIIDSTTGLISADAYSTCLESYYTCMDEICTARSAAKRRCSCAARVKNFMDAEEKLKSANEELIKASGELALLIANKGKDVTSAFTLTEAEQVMNCVSYQDAKTQYGEDSEALNEWCYNHGIFGSSSRTITIAGVSKTGFYPTTCTEPDYCSNNNFGFDMGEYAKVQGSASDILASLQAWADAKDKSLSYVQDDTKNLFSAYENVSGVVSDLSGISAYNETTLDNLAQTWGYDLFKYAHNNVCGRVLDSCFNGIFEACGTPPSGGRCANGASSSCPYNYNSMIEVSTAGDVTLNDRTKNVNASASCFGYTSTSGDPYASLRGPVADARRSVMQKYLLDANADCDTFGEELKATAQNIAYQKVAAQQALQSKRLEFYNEERNKQMSDAIAASTNFNECISELWDCYETQASSNPSWPTARIKTYCAQVSNSPHCYQDMICTPSYAQFKAIIDQPDSTSCKWYASDYTKNTCRNLVTLNEILNGAATNSADNVQEDEGTGNSAMLREMCLQEALGCPDNNDEQNCIRSWKKITTTDNP